MIVRLNDTRENSNVSQILIKPKQFRNHVDVRPYAIEHELVEHPLLKLENIVELAKRLPLEQREYVFARQEFGTHEHLDQYEHADPDDEWATDELIGRIAEQNRVIVLRNVENDPLYGRFVNECLDRLSSQIEGVTGPISGRESFIFVSPPKAYTPYHYDPEQNFFLQVQGQKQMAIYDVNDREVLPESALETYYNDGQKITNCRSEYFDRYELYEMGPGDGVYVPVTAPHWVRTLDEVSISISINFRTPSSIRRDRVFRLNRMMRKMGLRPQRVSARADSVTDRIKAGVLGVPAAIKKMAN